MLLQRVILEILLHGVHLHHGVGDGRARGEHHAAPAGQLVQVAALHVEVAGLLGLGLADAAHVAHLRECREIFVVVGLVDKEAVHAQLFKGHHIILAALVVELFQLGLDGFLAAFKLLDGKPLSVVGFQLGQTVHDVPLLLFQDVTLALDGHGDFLKLRVTDDDGVVVAGGDSPTEPLTVLSLEVLPCGHQDVGGGIELKELRGPLFC